MGADEPVSVVMPVFNEAAVIEEVVEDLVRDVIGTAHGGEIVVVDDCSTDETRALLDRLASRHPVVRILRNERNLGHGPSVVRGLDEARHHWIFLVDSDAQFVMSEFALLWGLRNDVDVVLGRRSARAGSRHRALLSRLLERLGTRLAGRQLHDPNVPFKLLRTSVWRDLRRVIGRAARVPSVMISIGASLRRWRIAYVPITHLPRNHAPSTLRGARLAGFSIRAAGDLIAFRSRVRSLPARGKLPEEAERDSPSVA